MNSFKKILVLALSAVMTVTLFVGCDKGKKIDEKLPFSTMLANYSSSPMQETDSSINAKITFYTTNKVAETIEETLNLKKTVVNEKSFVSATAKTTYVTSGIAKIVKGFLDLGSGFTQTQMNFINDFIKGNSTIHAEVGYNEDFYNAKLDLCANGETPNWLLPKELSNDNTEKSMFVGMSSENVNKKLLGAGTADYGLASLDLLFSNGILKLLDYSKATDGSGKSLNKGDNTFLYTMNFSAEKIKASFVSEIEKIYQKIYDMLNSTELTRPQAELFQKYYDKYKNVIFGIFNFENIEINAKADATGKVISLDYKTGITVSIDTNAIRDIIEEVIDDPAEKSKIDNIIKGITLFLGSKSGASGLVDFRVEISNKETIRYSNVAFANPESDIFARLNGVATGRVVYVLNLLDEIVPLK